jgi:hypothetical protein
MAQPLNDDLRGRREAAALLGLGDVDRLSPADTLRCDLIATLRLVIDDAGATVLAGSSTDLARLITATESLIALLPGKALPEPAAPEGGKSDPRQIMLETYLEMRRRGEFADPMSTREGCLAEVERLRARVAELEAGAENSALDVANPNENSGGKSGSAENSALAPNVVPLSRSAPAAPPTPAPAAAPGYDYNANQDWKSYVEPDGSIRSTPRGRWDA